MAHVDTVPGVARADHQRPAQPTGPAATCGIKSAATWTSAGTRLPARAQAPSSAMPPSDWVGTQGPGARAPQPHLACHVIEAVRLVAGHDTRAHGPLAAVARLGSRLRARAARASGVGLEAAVAAFCCCSPCSLCMDCGAGTTRYGNVSASCASCASSALRRCWHNGRTRGGPSGTARRTLGRVATAGGGARARAPVLPGARMPTLP